MSGEKTAEPVVATSVRSRKTQMLMMLFSTLLGLWIAALIAMYLTTVYPQRHLAPTPMITK